jgi:hypothetical protein
MMVGSVMNSTDGTVRFYQRVRPLDDISIAHLMLGLLITGVTILNSVIELVLGVSLQDRSLKIKITFLAKKTHMVVYCVSVSGMRNDRRGVSVDRGGVAIDWAGVSIDGGGMSDDGSGDVRRGVGSGAVALQHVGDEGVGGGEQSRNQRYLQHEFHNVQSVR